MRDARGSAVATLTWVLWKGRNRLQNLGAAGRNFSGPTSFQMFGKHLEERLRTGSKHLELWNCFGKNWLLQKNGPYPSGKTTVLGDSPKRLENHEKKRLSQNRWEGGFTVDFRCAHDRHPPLPVGKRCCLCEGSKTSVLSSAPNLHNSSKKKKCSRNVANDHEIFSKISNSAYLLIQSTFATLYWCRFSSIETLL